ncbi:MAG: MiaB/RimO family radical SAM methylthiotransferase [Candidatus Auribacterota bacterium]|nr:MiaB/RimO family radical SAM methylthiotransferase [Candidatus Auribacterota bacterium]
MTENKPTFALSTFGCKVNQYESQVIRERLLKIGYREDNERPDLVIINSCAVTARAEAKTRKEIRRRLRRAPDSRIIPISCGLTYSELQNRSLWELVPQKRRGIFPADFIRSGPWNITFSANHSRAFIKIQDGCNAFCSYCIIPYLRGNSLSRSPEEIVREISGLVNNGYREIVLTGINLGVYGQDIDDREIKLVILLEEILKLPKFFRLRLSSIEPKEITTSLVKLISEEERVCPHLHIPLQSGSDRVLKKMNRGYTFREYSGIIRSLREINPEISISADCLVGFPGEEEEDFQDTCRAVREIGFSKVHIFPYSRREGTVASRYPGIDQKTIRRRTGILTGISGEKALEYRRRFVGRDAEVIIEKKQKNGLYSGLDRHYNRIIFSGEKLSSGSLCLVRITGLDESGLKGVIGGK